MIGATHTDGGDVNYPNLYDPTEASFANKN